MTPTFRPRDAADTAHARPRVERLHVVSDGTPQGTRVTRVGSDDLIPVTRFVLSMPDAGSLMRGSVDVLLPQVDAVVDCDVREVCPYCQGDTTGAIARQHRMRLREEDFAGEVDQRLGDHSDRDPQTILTAAADLLAEEARA